MDTARRIEPETPTVDQAAGDDHDRPSAPPRIGTSSATGSSATAAAPTPDPRPGIAAQAPAGPPRGDGGDGGGAPLHVPAAAEDDLLARAELRRVAGRPHLAVEVDTADLGRVRVEARDGADGLSLQLRSDHAAGRHVLREHLEELRDDLRERGVDLGRLDVSDGRGSARDRADDRAGPHPTDRGTVRAPAQIAAAPSPDAGPTRATSRPADDNRLDLRL